MLLRDGNFGLTHDRSAKSRDGQAMAFHSRQATHGQRFPSGRVHPITGLGQRCTIVGHAWEDLVRSNNMNPSILKRLQTLYHPLLALHFILL
jgi:hypothetical protein